MVFPVFEGKRSASTALLEIGPAAPDMAAAEENWPLVAGGFATEGAPAWKRLLKEPAFSSYCARAAPVAKRSAQSAEIVSRNRFMAFGCGWLDLPATALAQRGPTTMKEKFPPASWLLSDKRDSSLKLPVPVELIVLSK